MDEPEEKSPWDKEQEKKGKDPNKFMEKAMEFLDKASEGFNKPPIAMPLPAEFVTEYETFPPFAMQEPNLLREMELVGEAAVQIICARPEQSVDEAVDKACKVAELVKARYAPQLEAKKKEAEERSKKMVERQKAMRDEMMRRQAGEK